MSARVCPVCGAFVKLPREDDDQIGQWPLRWPSHTEGKRRGAARCSHSGQVVPVVIPEQR